jgi:ABC-type molybdate transport system substrate-binding protein
LESQGARAVAAGARPGAGTEPSFKEIAALFHRAHAGTRVTLNLAGSQQLAPQLREGARADGFASADGDVRQG